MGDDLKKMLFLILIFSLFLSGCRSVTDMTAAEIMSRLDPRNGYLYISDSDISDANYISPETLGYLYYGEKTALAETDYTESYCIYINKSTSPKEIHIFKAKYQSDVDKLKRMLQSRADVLSKPRINPNNSRFLCDTAIKTQVFSKGRFVFLVAGEAAEITDNIEKVF